MKTPIFKMALLGCLATAGMTSCSSPEKKVEDAQTNVLEAKQDLQQARIDSANEYNVYREESEAKLRENDRQIAELKLQMKAERKEIRVKYEKEVVALDEKNENLKIKIKEYKEGDKSNWQSFKEGFNQDLDAVGKSISAMAHRNDKK
jgi:thiol:disulfide interchange protein